MKATKMKIALVSGGDHKYYPMILEWIESVNRLKPADQTIDLCILDAGLTQEQRAVLKTRVQHIASPEWPADLPAHKIKNKEFLKACAARPFLPHLFPDYDVYVWLDGDTWVQNWSAIELLIAGAQKSGLAICPQVDRAYGKAMRLKWLGPFPFKARSFYYSNARRAFSGKVARELFPYPTLNAGVFAISGNAPHWDRWQKLIVKALEKGKVFTAEQLSLGMMVYLEKFSAEFLPATCNWLLENKPVWDEDTQAFVEPFLPHQKVGIMHLSGCDKMRLDRSITIDIKTKDGKDKTLSYRYPYYDGERDEATELSSSSEAA